MSPAIASSSTILETCQTSKVGTHFYNISPANSSTESWYVMQCKQQQLSDQVTKEGKINLVTYFSQASWQLQEQMPLYRVECFFQLHSKMIKSAQNVSNFISIRRTCIATCTSKLLAEASITMS
jgi:hypothetical protein